MNDELNEQDLGKLPNVPDYKVAVGQALENPQYYREKILKEAKQALTDKEYAEIMSASLKETNIDFHSLEHENKGADKSQYIKPINSDEDLSKMVFIDDSKGVTRGK